MFNAMKKFLYAVAAIVASMMMSVSCDDMTDQEKEESAEALTKVILAGEWGCISITDTETGAPLLGESLSFTDEQGRPVTVWVLNLDGTYFVSPNRVWKDVILNGYWDVSERSIKLWTDEENSEESYEIVSYENELLTLNSGKFTMVLKRLTDADKCPQLSSIEFLEALSNDGKLHIDPRIGLSAGKYYQLTWKYNPENYEPYNLLHWTSSNPDVATVTEDGRVYPAEGMTSGQTTITLECDCVRQDITINFQVIN